MHLNEGIGVGLSTANSLVRAMGGNLSVSSFSEGRDFRNVVDFRVCTTEKSMKESFNDDLQKFNDSKRALKLFKIQSKTPSQSDYKETPRSRSSFDVSSFGSSSDRKPNSFLCAQKSFFRDSHLK